LQNIKNLDYNIPTTISKGVRKMKFTKLSLIAVLAITTAVAGDAKISGDTKLFYGTGDMGDTDLFNKNGAYGDTAVSLDYTKDISDTMSLNAGITGVSTLGLEGTLVSGTWAAHRGNGVQDTVWIDTANVVIKPIDKTMLVVGRQTLDTPLALTETWNISQNTFDAAVMVDNHLPDTTLIGAWVGRGNGHNQLKNIDGGMSKYGALNAEQEAGLQGKGLNIANKGAYAAAVITKLIPNTTTQLWYYNVVNQADALWAQADSDISGFSVGLQYANIMPKSAIDDMDDTKATALKVGYKVSDIDISAAYSKVSDEGLVYMGNTATAGAHAGQSKLYTEAWWNYGFVGQAGAESMALIAGYDNYTAQYTTVKNDNSAELEMDEITLTATTKIGGVDATLALINASSDDETIDGNTIQVYLTAPFSL
jgi:hypothetical protein